MIKYNGIEFDTVEELLEYQRATKPKSHHAIKVFEPKRSKSNRYTKNDISVMKILIESNKKPNGRLRKGIVDKIQKAIGHRHSRNSISQTIFEIRHKKK